MTTTNPLLIGLSGLQASQRGIATTGHNIANVNSESFSRQRVDFQPRPGLQVGASFLGTGTDLGTVRRIVDEFAIADLRNATSNFQQVEGLLAKAKRLDDLLGDRDTGLSPGLQSFFNAMQGVTNQADSIPSRQVLLSQSQLLVQRMSKLQIQLEQERAAVNIELQDSAGRVTTLAKNIAKTNEQLLGASTSTAGNQPSDLLDLREDLLRQLSELVSVTVVAQDNNLISVFIGSGQPLVVGTQAQTLRTQSSTTNPNSLDFVLDVGLSSLNIGQALTGGTIGGALEFLNGSLETSLNRVGLVATGLAQSVNAQHRLGMDLYGNLGGDYFTDINALAVARSRVAGLGSPAPTAILRADVSAVGQLTDSDYLLRYDGANFTLTRLSDNTVTTSAGLPINVDGMSISVSAGAVVAGDSFRVQPTKTFISQLAVQLTDERQIAAALPVRVEAPQIPVGNRGTGLVKNVNILATGAGTSIQNGALTPPVSIVFTSATNYEIRDSGAAVLGTGTIVAGRDNDLILTAVPNLPNLAVYGFTSLANLGYELTLGGAPLTGDTFSVSYNTGGVGGNGNAIKLAALQTNSLLDGGNSTFNEAYGSLVTEVGVRAREAEVNQSARSTLLRQAEARRGSISGVNLDEEAANLIKFQQAYAASAQIIAVTNEIFDTLLTSVR